MKVSLHPVVVVCSAALAACCLFAGRGRAPAPAPAARSAAVLHGAGQAWAVLRRRVRASARRALQALLLCLAAPLAARVPARGPELWVDPVPLPCPAAGRALKLPPAPDTAESPAAPPGQAGHPARASPGGKPPFGRRPVDFWRPAFPPGTRPQPLCY